MQTRRFRLLSVIRMLIKETPLKSRRPDESNFGPLAYVANQMFKRIISRYSTFCSNVLLGHDFSRLSAKV